MPKNHRTRFSPKLLLSLLAVILISWVNAKYFGIVWVKVHSSVFNQSVHAAALLMVAAIGAWNWKDQPEKWVLTLWYIMYGGVLVLMGILAVLYFIYGSYLNYSVLSAILAVRNGFTGPLPFFAVYLLIFAAKALDGGRNA